MNSKNSLSDHPVESAVLASMDNAQDSGPLNSAQQRLWYLYQTSEDQCQFNLVVSFSLQGAIDSLRLSHAIDELLMCHPAYRSRIDNEEGRGRQTAFTPKATSLVELDLSAMSLSEQENTIGLYRHKELHTSFDLSQSTSPRWQLFRQATDRYLLVMTVHHIVFDGQSLMVTIKDLAKHYSLTPELSSVRSESSSHMGLIDYALWEQSETVLKSRQESLAFWQPLLQRYSDPLQLPVVAPSETGASSFKLTLDRAGLKQVRKWAHSQKISPFTVLKAAFDLALFNYCGQQRFLVGTDIAGREHPDLTHTVGFFINQLPLPCSIDPDQSVQAWLKQIDSGIEEALEHKEAPFDRLVASQISNRTQVDTPLFQVKVNYQQRRAKGLKFGDAVLTKHQVYQHAGPYHLVLDLVHEENGITAEFEYQKRFFSDQKIQLIASQWRHILETFNVLISGSLAEAKAQLAQWEQQALSDQQRNTQQQRPASSLRARGKRRQAIAVSSASLVEEHFLDADRLLPLVIEPGEASMNLREWAKENQPMLEEKLLKHGSILFRGFDISTLDEFDQVVSALSPGALEYMFRASPRSRVDGNIYTSTDYPADQPIFLHNEHSYSPRFPLRLFFYCHNEAESGGETPIGCVREITRKVPDDIKARFRTKGIRYVRNYGDGFGLPWQSVFQTEDRAEVERYCDSMDIGYEWKDNDRLRTFQWGAAMMKHPRTGEELWFNHATFFHVSTLPAAIRDSLTENFDAIDLPTNTFYGDGSPIEPEVLEQLRSIYQESAVIFPWQQGDVLFMDNMLNVHGRTPFSGPRKVMVAMAEAQYGKDLVIGDTE